MDTARIVELEDGFYVEVETEDGFLLEVRPDGIYWPRHAMLIPWSTITSALKRELEKEQIPQVTGYAEA